MKKTIVILLIIIVSVIIGVFIWLATIKGSYLIKRSILIRKPVAQIWPLVYNVKNIPVWSPWLTIDPNSKITFNTNPDQIGTTLNWQGDITGIGNTTITKAEINKVIEQKTQFTKPYRISFLNTWQFRKRDSSTLVTSIIIGKIPIYIRFMTPQIISLQTINLERGLKMLKEFSEKGLVKSKVEFEGIVEAPTIICIGKKNSCQMNEVMHQMKIQYFGILAYAGQQKIRSIKPITIYHQINFSTNTISFTAGLVVDASFKIKGTIFDKVTLQSSKAIKVIFKGNYEHLLNGWISAILYAKTKNLEISKTNPAFEIYTNNPKESFSLTNLTSEIYIPIE